MAKRGPYGPRQKGLWGADPESVAERARIAAEIREENARRRAGQQGRIDLRGEIKDIRPIKRGKQ